MTETNQSQYHILIITNDAKLKSRFLKPIAKTFLQKQTKRQGTRKKVVKNEKTQNIQTQHAVPTLRSSWQFVYYHLTKNDDLKNKKYRVWICWNIEQLKQKCRQHHSDCN